jgi:hypothetical protein
VLVRFLLGLCAAAGLTAASMAQQAPPKTPPPAPAPEGPPCDAFRKNADGDWVAKTEVMVRGPTGPVQIRAGTLVNDDLQDELDGRCH